MQSVLVAAIVSDDDTKLVLENTNSSKYPRFECDLGAGVEIPPSDPKWHNYFLCGVKGILERKGTAAEQAKGIRGGINQIGLNQSLALFFRVLIQELTRLLYNPSLSTHVD
jgi:hypothetical protein